VASNAGVLVGGLHRPVVHQQGLVLTYFLTLTWLGYNPSTPPLTTRSQNGSWGNEAHQAAMSHMTGWCAYTAGELDAHNYIVAVSPTP
jgi:hypothetical protein